MTEDQTFNVVKLIGRIVHDVEIFGGEKTDMVKFSISVRGMGNYSAEKKKSEVGFITIKAWAELAENSVYLKKNDYVEIIGKLRHETWETEDAKKRSTYSVSATCISKVEVSMHKTEIERIG